jgi:drug/metabolite transporter (DMT)-like permease
VSAKRSPRKALYLCLIAILAWGSLPLALKICLRVVDPLTVTLVRFAVAGTITLVWQRKQIYAGVASLGVNLRLLLIGGFALTANHLLYVWGLRYSSAGNAQLFIQLAPLLFGVVSVLLFKEAFSWKRGGGVILLLFGLGLYFLENLKLLAANVDEYLLGCFLLVLAAITWVIYGSCQKVLNPKLGPAPVTAFFYVLATLSLLPFSNIPIIKGLDVVGVLALIYCGINTLVAYGAFAAAIHCWDASRVSATLSLVPICTMTLVEVFSRLTPAYVAAEETSALALFGASLVVLGSALAALGGSKPNNESI